MTCRIDFWPSRVVLGSLGDTSVGWEGGNVDIGLEGGNVDTKGGVVKF